MGKENEKKAKGRCGFKRTEEENQTETSKESSKSRSSNVQNIKETDPQDNNMEVTSTTGPIVNYPEGHNIPAKEHKINLSEKADNVIMIYNETIQQKYI